MTTRSSASAGTGPCEVTSGSGRASPRGCQVSGLVHSASGLPARGCILSAIAEVPRAAATSVPHGF